MKPRIAPQHYFPLKVYVRWARISLSQRPKVRPIESSPTHTGQTYAGNVRVVHTPGNVLAPRKSGQQFLPLNRGVRWADMGGLFVCRPNGHICSTAKTADQTLMVPTVAHGYGLEIPHPEHGMHTRQCVRSIDRSPWSSYGISYPIFEQEGSLTRATCTQLSNILRTWLLSTSAQFVRHEYIIPGYVGRGIVSNSFC